MKQTCVPTSSFFIFLQSAIIDWTATTFMLTALVSGSSNLTVAALWKTTLTWTKTLQMRNLNHKRNVPTSSLRTASSFGDIPRSGSVMSPMIATTLSIALASLFLRLSNNAPDRSCSSLISGCTPSDQDYMHLCEFSRSIY